MLELIQWLNLAMLLLIVPQILTQRIRAIQHSLNYQIGVVDYVSTANLLLLLKLGLPF